MQRNAAVLLSALLFCFATISLCRAQDMSTESKGNTISAFVGGLSVAPDIGHVQDYGIVAGANFTSYFKFLPFAPSLEVRGTDVHGSYANQRTVSVGVQAMRRFGRYFPYANFLVGEGSVVYPVDPEPFEHVDRGLEYSIGGGLDIAAVHNFRVRIDFQQQLWNLGPNTNLAPQPSHIYTFAPVAIMLGVNYVIPFHPHTDFLHH